MLAKSFKEYGYIMMVLSGLLARVELDGETASAKRTQCYESLKSVKSGMIFVSVF